MSTEPVNFDISGTADEQTDALMQALLSGQPLTISDSTRPDVPVADIGLELSRANDRPLARPEATMVTIDGTDALFFLIVRAGPNSTPAGGSNVLLEHGGHGLSRGQAGYILRQVADRLDAAEQAEASRTFPPRGGHSERCAYAAGISRTCTCD
jgi:hypothetical protein